MLIIFAGSIGRFPVGGHAWIDMQYLIGLRALGHDVFYLEECGEESWVYDWRSEDLTTEIDYPTAYLRDCLEEFGFGTRWIYRAGEKWEGMTVAELREICSRADLLLVRGAPISLWRQEYGWPRRRAFIDVDPGFTQFSLASGHRDLSNTVERCEHLFTIAQRIGAKDCSIPKADRQWLKTVSPISLPEWPCVVDGATHFTSVMQWRSYQEVVHKGVSYGNKDKEFPKFIDLPHLTRQRFLMALTGGSPEVLTEHGWEVVPGWIASETLGAYHSFIQQSRAEIGVAKHGYVLTRGGWFSDRSVCYLASGRPVLVQDTGLADWLPIGEGIVTFRDLPEAARGVEAINADYEGHRRSARRLAEEYFAAERVLPQLLESAMS